MVAASARAVSSRVAAPPYRAVSTLEAATGLLAALDANDAEGVRAWLAPDAYWWVDTGHDRVAGWFDVDPGPTRPWPLHGRMDAQAKCDLLRGVPERFPGGVRQIVRRVFAAGATAVLEVEGDGIFLGERAYRNRYCFVITARDGAVTAVHEYLDTAHAADVFAGRHLDRRSALEDPFGAGGPVRMSDGAGATRVALAFTGCLTHADARGLSRLCAPGATWWGDGGRIRTAGPEAPVDGATDVSFVGRVPIALKLDRIARLRTTFPRGLRVAPRRVHVADEVPDDVDASGLVAIEALGDGVHHSGRTYQNRYVFLLALDHSGRIAEVREYCDTQHAFDVFGLADRVAAGAS